jgi:multidrug efflux system outer membrane protein
MRGFRSAATALCALPLALLAAGCTMAPVYQRPAAPVAPSYPGAAPQAPPAPAPTVGWRDFLADPRLARLIELALANNRDLRISALNIDLARAQYQIQGAALLPSISAGASDARQRTPAPLRLPGEPAVQSVYGASVGLNSYELDFFGRVRSLKEAALDDYLATEQARRSAHISLVAQVADAYLATLAYDEQLELTRKTLASREDAYRIAQLQFHAGTLSALDLRQSETLVRSAQADFASQSRARAQAQNALTLLVGQTLPEDLPPPRPLAEQGLADDLPAGLPSDLLERRPDLLEAEAQLQAQNANIGAARAAFFPRITLTGSDGFSSLALAGLFHGEARSWSFTPALTLPLFNGGALRANLDAAKVQRDIAVATYEKAVQTAFREVADGLAARGTYEQQLEAQDALVRAEDARLALARLRYDKGVASFLDVLDAERELFTAQQSLIAVRLARLTNLVDLYKALGGGWNEHGAAAASGSPQPAQQLATRSSASAAPR